MKKFYFLYVILSLLTYASYSQTIFSVNAGGNTFGTDPVYSEDYPTKSIYNKGAASRKEYATYSLINATDVVDDIFRTTRYLSNPSNYFRFEFPVALGNYEINLYFVEFESTYSIAGTRVFDVDIEGETVLKDFDIVSDTGYRTATKKTFFATVDDGMLVVEFKHGLAGNPSVAAISISDTGADISLLTLVNPIIDFSTVEQSTSSQIISVDVQNNSAVDINIINVSQTSGGSDFIITPLGITTVAAGQTTTVAQAQFTPQSEGTFNGNILIEHDAINSPSNVALTGTGGPIVACDVYYEEDGIVTIELENGPWEGTDWVFENIESGYFGSGYLRWNGGDRTGYGGIGTMEYTVNITNPGRYAMELRSWQPGPNSTLENDAWLTSMDTEIRLRKNSDGLYDDALTAVAGTWFKSYQGVIEQWVWYSNYEHNGVNHTIVADFPTAGEYTIAVSGRAQDFAIDRLLLSKDSNYPVDGLSNGTDRIAAKDGSRPLSFYKDCNGVVPTTPDFVVSNNIIEDEDFVGTKSTQFTLTSQQPLTTFTINPTSVSFATITINNNVLSVTAIANLSGTQDFVVTANNGTYTYDQPFTLTVNPVNDPPLFAFDNTTFNLLENFANLYVQPNPVVQYPDEWPENLVYSIENNLISTFATVTINASTGELKFSSQLDLFGSGTFDVVGTDDDAQTRRISMALNVEDILNCDIPITYYADSDGDGFGDINIFVEACSQPVGYISNGYDLNDLDPTIGAIILNQHNFAPNPIPYRPYGELITFTGQGLNNIVYVEHSTWKSPNNVIDKTFTNITLQWGSYTSAPTFNDGKIYFYDINLVLLGILTDLGGTTLIYEDTDGDTYGSTINNIDANGYIVQSSVTQFVGHGGIIDGYVYDGTDCDDTDATINSNTVWYADSDGDGFGDINTTEIGCISTLLNATLDNTDCDDTNDLINPNAVEIPGNSIDENCDGIDGPLGDRVTSFILVDPVNDIQIREIFDGDQINIDDLTNNKMNIIAVTDPDPVGSVYLELSGTLTNTRTENGSPYLLFGDNGQGNYYDGSAALGSYALTATPYSGRSRSGDIGIAKTISFDIIVVTGPVAPTITFLTPDTDLVFVETEVCTTIQVRAKDDNLLPAGTLEVENLITGVIETTSFIFSSTELDLIYDIPLCFTSVDNYKVTLTSVDSDGLTDSDNMFINVLPNQPPSVVFDQPNVTLYLPLTDPEICATFNFNIIDELDIPTLDTGTGVVSTTSNVSSSNITYSNNFGQIAFCADYGTTVIDVIVTDNLGQTATSSITINVVEPLGGPEVTKLVLIDAILDAPISEYDPIAGNPVIDLALLTNKQLNIDAIVGDPTIVSSVEFLLNGISVRTENKAPYAYKGDNGTGDYYSWTPIPGDYTIEAIPYPERNRGGIAGISSVVTFTIIDSDIAAAAARTSGGTTTTAVNVEQQTTTENLIDGVYLSIYPNPAKQYLNVLVIDYAESDTDLTIFDQTGRIVYNQTYSKLLSTQINLDEFDNGIYMLKITNDKTNTVERFMIMK